MEDRKRIDRMMWYFGWSPQDLAEYTGYSVHNIYHNMTKKASVNLMNTVERFESLSQKTIIKKDITKISPVKIIEKGWHNLDKSIVKLFEG